MTFDTEPSIEEAGASGGRELVVAYLPQIWVFTIGLLNYSILTRVLGTEGMGGYVTCTVFVLLLMQLFLMGAEFGTQYFMMSKEITVHEAATLNVVYSTLAALMAVAVGLLLVRLDLGFLSDLFKGAPSGALYLSTTMILPLAIGHAFTVQLSGLRRYGVLARAQLFRTATQALTVLILVWALDLGLNGGILALTGSHVVLVALLFRDLRRKYGIVMKFPERRWFARTVGYGVRANPLHLGMGLERRMGVVGLNLASHPSAEVGFLGIAISHIGRLVEMPQVVGVVIYPRLFNKDADEDRIANVAAFSLWLRLIGYVMVLMALGLVAGSWPLVMVLHGPKFSEVVPLLWMLAPGLVAMALAAVLVPYFNSIEKPGMTSWSMGIGVLVNLACLVVLLPALGFQGAALALSAGASARALVLAMAYHRTAKVSVLAVWMPRRGDLAYLMSIVRDALGMLRLPKSS